jgi:hypothetical protein
MGRNAAGWVAQVQGVQENAKLREVKAFQAAVWSGPEFLSDQRHQSSKCPKKPAPSYRTTAIILKNKTLVTDGTKSELFYLAFFVLYW